jgi:hypothetical protein
VSTDGGILAHSTTADQYTSVDILLFVDGNPRPSGFYRRVQAVNNANNVFASGTWSFSGSMILAPGVHTIDVRARFSGQSGSVPASVSGDTSSNPDTSDRQGELTVLILKK